MPAGREPQPDDLNALFALVGEVRDGQIRLEEQANATGRRIEEQASTTAQHSTDILALQLAQARHDGSIRVLLWLVPGGPALVGIIGGIVVWVTR